jgi:nucleoside-diphosphate-sugar epimerase
MEKALKDKKVLIVGCGDIGNVLGCTLADAGAMVWGVRRDPAGIKSPIHAVKADVTQLGSLNLLRDVAFDYIVVTLTPADFSDEGYRRIYVNGFANLLSTLESRFTGLLLYVSSTSVYHQHEGQWVDENSETLPTSFSGRRLLEAELLLQQYKISSTVVRFAGIYGPGRRRLIEQVLALNGCPQSPAVYTNRIHRDDCVGFLAHLITRHYNGAELDNLYLAVDSMPVPMWSVKQWLALQLSIDVKTLDCSGTVRRTSKRCSNQRMLASGYKLLYPDYQNGYIELVKNEI